jgi:murein L,D-transpeptidase YafK
MGQTWQSLVNFKRGFGLMQLASLANDRLGYISKKRLACFCLSLVFLLVSAPAAWAAKKPAGISGNWEVDPETRLIEIQRLFAQGYVRDALKKAEALQREVPNFRAAHLVYGDLLKSTSQRIGEIGAVQPELAKLSETSLLGLREEFKVRMLALKDLPIPGSIPSQFISLSPEVKYAMAIDASKSRLYLFENTAGAMRLLAHYYVSVGKYGIGKAAEGDQRTPLGIYFLFRILQGAELPTLFGPGFYGPTALTLNYPNPLDLRRGKTGGGIWLHGTPATEFARIPRASDGCVVLSNADLTRIARIVPLKTTPVVIADRLQWVQPSSLSPDNRNFSEVLSAWKTARTAGDSEKLVAFYENNFNNGKTLGEWMPVLKADIDRMRGHRLDLRSLSVLRWLDKDDTMVVTFTESLDNNSQGPLKRQYWTRSGKQWKIFYEGIIG